MSKYLLLLALAILCLTSAQETSTLRNGILDDSIPWGKQDISLLRENYQNSQKYHRPNNSKPSKSLNSLKFSSENTSLNSTENFQNYTLSDLEDYDPNFTPNNLNKTETTIIEELNKLGQKGKAVFNEINRSLRNTPVFVIALLSLIIWILFIICFSHIIFGRIVSFFINFLVFKRSLQESLFCFTSSSFESFRQKSKFQNQTRAAKNRSNRPENSSSFQNQNSSSNSKFSFLTNKTSSKTNRADTGAAHNAPGYSGLSGSLPRKQPQSKASSFNFNNINEKSSNFHSHSNKFKQTESGRSSQNNQYFQEFHQQFYTSSLEFGPFLGCFPRTSPDIPEHPRTCKKI